MSSSARGLAGRYAGALYALAEKQGKINKVVKDLTGLAALLGKSSDLALVVSSPAIPWAQQAAAITAIMKKGRADKLSQNFVGTVATNGRLHALPGIITAFLAEHAKRRGEVQAQVISAVKLDAKRRKRVETAVARVAGSKKLSLEMKVDPSLIGGLVVQIGSRMIDTSLKTKLNRLEAAMKDTS